MTAVKRKPLVAVVGCSGSGKSSVVFAGLIPWLRQDTNVRWQIVSFRPGNNPIEALAAAIAPLVRAKNGEDENARLVELELEVALRQNNKALYKIIESFVQATATRLVLIADQFEELYTDSAGERKPTPFRGGMNFDSALLSAVKPLDS